MSSGHLKSQLGGKLENLISHTKLNKIPQKMAKEKIDFLFQWLEVKINHIFFLFSLTYVPIISLKNGIKLN